MRKTITALAIVVTTAATGFGVLATGAASAATGRIWLDGNHPHDTSVTIAAGTPSCQSGTATVPHRHPDAVPTQRPQYDAVPNPDPDQSDPGTYTHNPGDDDAYNAF